MPTNFIKLSSQLALFLAILALFEKSSAKEAMEVAPFNLRVFCGLHMGIDGGQFGIEIVDEVEEDGFLGFGSFGGAILIFTVMA